MVSTSKGYTLNCSTYRLGASTNIKSVPAHKWLLLNVQSLSRLPLVSVPHYLNVPIAFVEHFGFGLYPFFLGSLVTTFSKWTNSFFFLFYLAGCLVLVGGDPGVGKSTLLLQV